MEVDLDPPRLPGPASDCGYVGDATPVHRLSDRVIHNDLNNGRLQGVPAGSVTIMGQKIEVISTVIGDVVLFDLDRSLTGQDGLAFGGAPASPDGPPALLAQRLFQADEAISNVYILSNLVSVRRAESWPDEAVAEASRIISNLFIVYPVETDEERIERLRAENYNATITSIRAHNPDLWIMKIRPDEPIEPFKPGQYTTLGLGFWEPRADDALEDFDSDPELRYKMARRSYSVSSSIIDQDGNLEEPHPEEVEFYIVLVPLTEEEITALTRRIWMKGVDDRIYMSRKFTGRYTLDGVDPTDNVVFLATGTGEAPHNKMVAELLRRQHPGKILSAVCVR